MTWRDNGKGDWVWAGGPRGMTPKPTNPPPSAGGAPPPARQGNASVPEWSGPNPTFTPDPTQYKNPGSSPNPGKHPTPTHNPFTGEDLVQAATREQTQNLLVDPVTGRRYNPQTGAWENPTAPPVPASTAPVDPSAAAAAAAAQGARDAAARGQDPSAGATQAARQATGQPAPEPPGTSTTSGPPVVDRERVDSILSQINEIGGYLKSIGLSDAEFSAAAAQLQLGLDRAQQQSLTLARSGNRRDRAANERLAIMQNAQMANEATRSAALLRAEEEEANRRIKLDAFTRAGELGLNAGALDLDAQQLDMQAATTYLNNLFERERLGMQLDQAEAERVTNFIRDMSLIAKDYYALNLQERQAIRDDLTRRYGITEQTRLGLEQLDSQPGFWEQAALGLIGGAGQGATMAIGAKVLGVSDERAKTAIRDTTEEELEELLAATKSSTYEYRDPSDGKGRFMSDMAQDLQKSELGRSLVVDDGGKLKVDGVRAGMTALSALGMVHNRLKALEEAI